MQRRKFSRKFKLEAVKPVRERGVAVAQAARDLDLRENVRRESSEADGGSEISVSVPMSHYWTRRSSRIVAVGGGGGIARPATQSTSQRSG